MDDRAFASATELTNEIRDRRIGCVEGRNLDLSVDDRVQANHYLHPQG